ncbi:hypothetical protein ACXPWS_00755 [Mycobacterium sp. BMJ-28]
MLDLGGTTVVGAFDAAADMQNHRAMAVREAVAAFPAFAVGARSAWRLLAEAHDSFLAPRTDKPGFPRG